MSLVSHLRNKLLGPVSNGVLGRSQVVLRTLATDDQGGKAAQTKPDDPNTIAPQGAQDVSSSGEAKSGHSKPPSDQEVEEAGKSQGRDDADKGNANVHEGGADKNEAADDPNSDTAQRFKNVSNTERDAGSTA